MNKREFMRHYPKAYVNPAENLTKCVRRDEDGNEWQIVFRGQSSVIGAKESAKRGEFKEADTQPLELDEHTAKIRSELKRLSEEIVRIMGEAPKQRGFNLYDNETKAKTEKLAYQIYDIKQRGEV